MRTSRRLTWLIYAVCVLLVVDGLAWVTWQMLSLERREHAAQQHAQEQEAVRLALWRMDGLLSPVIAAEAARPYFHYRSFYPAERAYARMWEERTPGEVLVPSPLLAGPGEFIRLHFESTPDGWLTSPQAPDAEFRDRAESAALSLPDVLTVERDLNELTAILRGAPAMAGESVAAPALDDAGRTPGERLLGAAQQDLHNYALEQREKTEPELLELDTPAVVGQGAVEEDRSLGEYQARQRNALQSRDFADTGARQSKAEPAAEPADRNAGLPGEAVVGERDDGAVGGAPGAVQTGRFAPVWRTNPVTGEPELLFVRAVTVGGRESTQGFWIDWPSLRAALLGSIRDLLPDAELVPLVRSVGGTRWASTEDSALHAGLLLAGVPAVLVPGSMDTPGLSGLTPTRIVLLGAWVAVLAAVLASAGVLRASLALSERRGRFVSAVTHELRTPLTTLCLYSQMLDDGMVRDESKRGEYLGTLRREAERLATIVENVLAYARVGVAGAAVSPHEVVELLRAAAPSLAESASQCGMVFELDAEGVDGLRVACDHSSLERIVRNLVDNACKYARGAEDNRVTLRVRPAGQGVEFRVRDRGPGVPGRERRRVFSPFTRARVNGADGSSGLGLGLALARGVARSRGGELRLGRPAGPGAEFVLWLPVTGR